MRIISWRRLFRFIWVLQAAGVLTSCVTLQDTGWDPQAYTVKKGDTLYSISWRYEKDFRDIARWNKVSAPYNIYPGQRILLAPGSGAGYVERQSKSHIDKSDEPFEVPAVTVGSVKTEPVVYAVPLKKPETKVSSSRPETIVVRKGDTLYSIARYQKLDHKQLARWNFLNPPYAIYPGKTLKLRPQPTSLARKNKDSRKKSAVKTGIKSAAKQVTPQVAASVSLPGKVKAWQWPAKGKLVKTFNAKDTNRKGIGIAGRKGQAIKAAASGRVVYSGNGLIHYGNLVIIKHSNSFLSAYAHNRSLLVKEGDQVRAGQNIAKMGTVESGRPRLHFEIRKSGKPINPLRYLPKRKS